MEIMVDLHAPSHGCYVAAVLCMALCKVAGREPVHGRAAANFTFLNRRAVPRKK